MADWSENSPGDSDIVSQFPADERAARAAAKSNFGVDHHEEDDADVGKHEVVQVLDNTADPTIDSGDIGVWNNGGKLNTRVGGGSVQRMVSLAAGTAMLFHQAAAPTGWTQDTTVNDRVLRMVSGAGAGTGGSWTISGVTVDNHALTVSEMPAHDHGGGGNTGNDTHSHSGSTSNDTHNHSMATTQGDGGSVDGKVDDTHSGGGTGSINTANDTHNHTFTTNSDTHNHSYSIPSQGGGNGHNHGLTADGNWRPSYVDIIAATLD